MTDFLRLAQRKRVQRASAPAASALMLLLRGAAQQGLTAVSPGASPALADAGAEP